MTSPPTIPLAYTPQNNDVAAIVVNGNCSSEKTGKHDSSRPNNNNNNNNSMTKNNATSAVIQIADGTKNNQTPLSSSSSRSASSSSKVFERKESSDNDNRPDVNMLNPISKWEEPLEIPYLTLYDVHRKPRSVITDPNTRIRMPLKALNAEFQCPICLGYMKKCAIVMECLHRFCGECVQKCLRLGKKECPTCRIHIPSRRSLRPDPNFDKLIQKIYGNIDALEKVEEREIETLNKLKNMNNAYAESCKLGIMQQAISRKKTNNKGMVFKPNNKQLSGNKRKQTGPPIIHDLEESPLVDFILRRHPQEVLVDRLKREYIRTSGDITVLQLKHFLSKKLSFQPYTHFQIIVVAGGKGVILDDSISVHDVRRDICDVGEVPIVVMHYRIHPVY